MSHNQRLPRLRSRLLAPTPSREPEPEPEPEILGVASAPEPKVGAMLLSVQKSKNFVILLNQIAPGAGAANLASASALGAKSRSRDFYRGNLWS
ncbi:unnamed protein product [Bursaphelenchus xylophilus]|uniref:(pine wood nematode) hypothetical protein n=1 Tax=Bursaphelenchus xylophilus TaxID=6326 RepID=A0A1I7RZN5_BURXY|nr:unnamed protein product [Bursaphelenchus xylophilus]CAG9111455.1 unnamed protein product [Bursaphelenchus xylophilus]